MSSSPRPARSAAARIAVAVLVGGLAGSCAADLLTIRTEVCARAIEVLNPADATIVRGRVANAGENAVRIEYRVERAGRARMRSLTCRFRGPVGSDARTVEALETEAGPLSEPSWILLDRFLYRAPTTESREARAVAEAPEVPYPVALAIQHAAAGLPGAAVLGLLASAYALIFGLVGRVVLGFGEFAVLGGQAALLALGATILAGSTTPVVGLGIGLLVAAGAAALHGAVTGRVIVAPLVPRGGQAVLIATAGLMIALSEYLRLAQGDGFRWMPPLAAVPRPLVRSDDFVAMMNPVTPAIAVTAGAVMLGLLFAMRRTRFGRDWRAVRDDAGAAALCGIDHRAVLVRSFALSAALAGIAGFLIVVRFGGIGFSGGLALALKSFVGAVIGGIGSVPGAMAGGLLIGIVDAGWAAVMPLETREIAIYALLSVVLVLRPSGLFASDEN